MDAILHQRRRDARVTTGTPAGAAPRAFSRPRAAARPRARLENKEDLNQKRASQVKKVDLKNQENENPFVHSFEKVHTLDQYTGGMKTQDGSDEITDHSEALGELQMDTVSISTETAESILKTNYVGGYQWHANLKPQQEISAKSEIYYPEWDFKKKSYRSAWCRVKESNEAEIPTGSCIEETEKKEVRKVTDFIMALKNQRSWRTQQDDGEEIDIDSFQDALVDVRVVRTPNDRLYCRKTTTSHDWCVLILLDQSLSTESWLGDNQVLELEKKIATVLGSSFQNVGIVWGLASFYSNTRRDAFGAGPPTRSFSLVFATDFNGLDMALHIVRADRGRESVALTMPRLGLKSDGWGWPDCSRPKPGIVT